MLLSALLNGIAYETKLPLSEEIEQLTVDSRRAAPATLFCCIRGLTRDGHDFAEQAAQAGAVVLVDHDMQLERQIIVENTRLAFADICENYFGNPLKKLKLIGITGTNGKTSITYMLKHILEKSGCIARVYVVPLGDYQREIALTAPPALRILLYRRLMFRVAERIARLEGAKALVTGESLGQVASQTIDNIRAVEASVSLPVFRPLIGTDKLEIIAMAKELGTFDISSMDAPDCCTLFMPRSPETHAKVSDVEAAENAFPIDTWVDELVSAAESHRYRCPSYKRSK